MLPKNRKPVPVKIVDESPGAATESKRPRDASIRKAKGGYIIRLSGGTADWNDNEVVKEKLDDGIKAVKNWLDNGKTGEEKEE